LFLASKKTRITKHSFEFKRNKWSGFQSIWRKGTSLLKLNTQQKE
jgi:hypothetical protein